MELQWQKALSTRENLQTLTVYIFGECLMMKKQVSGSLQSTVYFLSPDGKFHKTEKQLIDYMDRLANGR